MTAYISVSLVKRKSVTYELNAIIEALEDAQIQPFIFVDKYIFEASDEKRMMSQAMIDIDNCDLLIAETSDKAIGIGVEVGYAKAKNKPLVYIRKNIAEHSTTIAGISDYQIVYETIYDLKTQLAGIIQLIKTQKL